MDWDNVQAQTRRRITSSIRRAGRATRNALELARRGRLSKAYHADYTIEHVGRDFRLRRYGDPAARPRPAPALAPLLLVPPLMVTADIYDVSPDTSAVTYLVERGIDVWLVDFGAPEREHGGMRRTLDDHVMAVDEAIERVRRETESDVHLGGYSQGGLFVYQTAAYRRGEGIASVITMGSPVDLRRNLPIPVHEAIAEGALRAARDAIAVPLEMIDGLPGALTSAGFKLVSVRKEIKQLVQFVTLLHDRDALERREPKRRFLGGEGFVAWPGPALRSFIDEVLVANRMASGGIVIAGRSVSLAELDAPVLYFVGTRDDFARPRSVRFIRSAVGHNDVHEVALRAGHFGLVVGTQANTVTWPAVVDWIRWRAGGARPATFDPPGEASPPERSPLRELAEGLLDELWSALGAKSLEALDAVDLLRWQLPRVARLRAIDEQSRFNMGVVLAEQAAARPEATFLMWGGRGFTYDEADRRVNQVATALVNRGVGVGDRVALVMQNHPDMLTATTALARIGAVTVLLPTDLTATQAAHGIRAARARGVLTSPERAASARKACPEGELWVLGTTRDGAALPDGAVDVDQAIDRRASTPPTGMVANPGRGADIAIIYVQAASSQSDDSVRLVRISHRRWAISALGAAAACKLKPTDTVYTCLPLWHRLAFMAAAGGAMVAGARLALAPGPKPEAFWPDVRRFGVTVAFYSGGLARRLVAAPVVANEHRHPVRLFVGSGLDRTTWRALDERFQPRRILELDASVEGNAVLANLRGEKIGCSGEPFLAGSDMALVPIDLVPIDLVPIGGKAVGGTAIGGKAIGGKAIGGKAIGGKAIGGKAIGLGANVQPCGPGRAGGLLARMTHRAVEFDREHNIGVPSPVVHDVFRRGDAWLNTGAAYREDDEGGFWPLGRVEDLFSVGGKDVFPWLIEEALHAADGVAQALAYGAVAGAGLLPVAEVSETSVGAVTVDGLLTAVRTLPAAARPRLVWVCGRLETDDLLCPTRVPRGLPLRWPRGRGKVAAYDAAESLYRWVEEAEDDWGTMLTGMG